jgi:hypothetical protein
MHYGRTSDVGFCNSPSPLWDRQMIQNLKPTPHEAPQRDAPYRRLAPAFFKIAICPA